MVPLGSAVGPIVGIMHDCRDKNTCFDSWWFNIYETTLPSRSLWKVAAVTDCSEGFLDVHFFPPYLGSDWRFPRFESPAPSRKLEELLGCPCHPAVHADCPRIWSVTKSGSAGKNRLMDGLMLTTAVASVCSPDAIFDTLNFDWFPYFELFPSLSWVGVLLVATGTVLFWIIATIVAETCLLLVVDVPSSA